jgi:hypothetical protein
LDFLTHHTQTIAVAGQEDNNEKINSKRYKRLSAEPASQMACFPVLLV